MNYMKYLCTTVCLFKFILLGSTFAGAQVAESRKPSAPVVKTTESANPAPASDKSIIIVGGRTKGTIKKPNVPTGPLETRDEAPPNPNAVSFLIYIPKGQKEKTEGLSLDRGPRPKTAEQPDPWRSSRLLFFKRLRQREFVQWQPKL